VQEGIFIKILNYVSIKMGQIADITTKSFNGIMSNVLSKQVVDHGTAYSSGTNVNQTIIGGTKCKNTSTISVSNQIQVNTNIYTNQQVYQDVVNDIVNQVSEDVQQKAQGILTKDQTEDLKTTIRDLVSTGLTAEQLILTQESVSVNMTNNQYCISGMKGTNIFVGTTENIYNSLYKSYSVSNAVQDVSNQIQNFVDLKTSQTKEGMMSSIFKILAVVFVIVCIVGTIAFLGFIYTVGSVAKMFSI
jgi:hypothetical protein